MEDRPAKTCDSHSHLWYLGEPSSFPRAAFGLSTLEEPAGSLPCDSRGKTSSQPSPGHSLCTTTICGHADHVAAPCAGLEASGCPYCL